MALALQWSMQLSVWVVSVLVLVLAMWPTESSAAMPRGAAVLTELAREGWKSTLSKVFRARPYDGPSRGMAVLGRSVNKVPVPHDHAPSKTCFSALDCSIEVLVF